MEALTAIDDFMKSNNVRVNFLAAMCVILPVVWGRAVWVTRSANLAFNSAFFKRNALASVRVTGIVAIAMLVGWRCGLGATEGAGSRIAAAAAKPEIQTENHHEGAKPSVEARKPLFQFRAKPVVCGDHVGAPEDSFELIGEETYRCKKCGQTGMLALSLVDGGLVFSPD